MRWGIVILLLLGVVAAACAAVLMGALSVGSSASGEKLSKTVEVAMARESLPAMTVLTLDDITKEMVSRNDLPNGQLVSSGGIVGRVLGVPVVEGQVLTESCFVTEGSGSQIIAQIPRGMRAFTVPVSSKAMPDRALLNPGCVVDVLVAYKLSSRNSEGEALSTTMLRGIQVLAISGDLVVSNPEQEEEKGTKKRDSSRGALVTLLVDTKQAEALQLAMENGNITLAIRNPLDKNEFDEDPSILNKGRLTPRGSDLPPAVLPSVGQESGSNNSQQMDSGNGIDGTNLPGTQPNFEDRYNSRRNPLREIEVIRGREKKVEEFDTAETETEKSAAKK